MQRDKSLPVVPEIMVPEESHPRYNVVVATNEDSKPGNALISFGVFFVASALLGYAIGSTPQQQIIIAMVIYLLLAMVTLVLISGHAVALWESLLNATVDRRRIAAQERVQMQYYATENKKVEYQHVEEMQRLQVEQQRLVNPASFAALQDSVQRLLAASDQPPLPKPSNYVPGTVDTARNDAIDWLKSLYDANGNLDNDKVTNSGFVRIAMPPGDARAIVERYLRLHKNGRNYIIDVNRYPTLSQLLNAITKEL